MTDPLRHEAAEDPGDSSGVAQVASQHDGRCVHREVSVRRCHTSEACSMGFSLRALPRVPKIPQKRPS